MALAIWPADGCPSATSSPRGRTAAGITSSRVSADVALVHGPRLARCPPQDGRHAHLQVGPTLRLWGGRPVRTGRRRPSSIRSRSTHGPATPGPDKTTLPPRSESAISPGSLRLCIGEGDRLTPEEPQCSPSLPLVGRGGVSQRTPKPGDESLEQPRLSAFAEPVAQTGDQDWRRCPWQAMSLPLKKGEAAQVNASTQHRLPRPAHEPPGLRPALARRWRRCCPPARARRRSSPGEGAGSPRRRSPPSVSGTNSSSPAAAAFG